jgi:uncharacterized protein (DUF362 family)
LYTLNAEGLKNQKTHLSACKKKRMVEMERLTRGEFLKLLSIATGAVLVNQVTTSCGPKPQTPTDLAVQSKPPGSLLPESSPTAKGAKPEIHPHLVVARSGSAEDLTRRALSALGGMQRFVPKGSRVIVKPNICVAYHTYEYAATTNPWVVGAIVKMCYEAGASKVQVMDFPFGGSPEEAYARSGIAEQVLLAGGEMVTMSRLKFNSTDIPAGQDLRQAQIYKDALDTDVLIDVPIAKHHSLARLTLGMKNLMGLIRDRGAIHRNLGQRLADLTSILRPDLTVVDAVRVLMANGPTGGDLGDVKELNTVIASADIVAADSYATTLFGLQPNDIDYIRAAAQMGLGQSNLNEFRIEEVVVDA